MLKLLKCRFSISSVEMNECLHFFQPPVCCLLFVYFMLGLINICFLNNCYACVHIKGSMTCTGDHLMRECAVWRPQVWRKSALHGKLISSYSGPQELKHLPDVYWTVMEDGTHSLNEWRWTGGGPLLANPANHASLAWTCSLRIPASSVFLCHRGVHSPALPPGGQTSPSC